MKPREEARVGAAALMARPQPPRPAPRRMQSEAPMEVEEHELFESDVTMVSLSDMEEIPPFRS